MILYGFLMDKHAAEISIQTKAGTCGYGLEMGGKGTLEVRSPAGTPLLEPGADFAGAHHGGWCIQGSMLFQHKEGF